MIRTRAYGRLLDETLAYAEYAERETGRPMGVVV